MCYYGIQTRRKQIRCGHSLRTPAQVVKGIMVQNVIESRSVGDFLKAVYSLQQRAIRAGATPEEVRISTNALAEALSISAPSVTDMARRLVEMALVDYRRYYGVRLTEEGELIALKLIRRHRLIELYLVVEMGYELHEVHDEAEVLEHAVSDRFVNTIYEKLGHPTHDPHGDPIPALDGTVIRRDLSPLSDIPLDTVAIVRRYDTQNNDVIAHILERGFVLGATVRVTSRDPFNGPVTSEINEETRVIGHHVANCIMVEVDRSVTDDPATE